MMGKVDRFVARKNVEMRNNPLETDGQAANHALMERQRRANDLRVKVPVTRLEAKPESNVSSLTALAKAVAARHPLRSGSETGSVSSMPTTHNITDPWQQKSKFDDTELEDSTISSIDGMPQEHRYVIENPSYNQISREILRVVDLHRYDQQYGEIDDDDGSYANPNILYSDDIPQVHDPAVFDEIAVARRVNARYLQAHSAPLSNFLPEPVVDRPSSPMVWRDRPPSRSHSAQKAIMPPPSNPNKSNVVIAPMTTAHSITVDKTSSYTDFAANRTPPPPEDRTGNRKKRPISDLLDHEPAVLKSMSFSDLDNQPFDLDPGRPTETASSTANPESHPERLSNLKSLSDLERAKFFTSQTRDQWAASTEFFEKRLMELFAELRVARDRRREVAMQFEGEVRERMGAVRESGEAIERCLAEMRGKARCVLPAKSGMGTPVR